MVSKASRRHRPQTCSPNPQICPFRTNTYPLWPQIRANFSLARFQISPASFHRPWISLLVVFQSKEWKSPVFFKCLSFCMQLYSVVLKLRHMYCLKNFKLSIVFFFIKKAFFFFFFFCLLINNFRRASCTAIYRLRAKERMKFERIKIAIVVELLSHYSLMMMIWSKNLLQYLLHTRMSSPGRQRESSSSWPGIGGLSGIKWR